MTPREWRLVQRIAAIVLVAALLPLGALAYRYVINPEATASPASTAEAAVFTLVPATLNLETATPTVATPLIVVVPNGWTEHTSAENDFAIALPPKWQRLPVGQKELEAALLVIRQSNPELATALTARGQQLMQTGVKFWAFDFDPESLKTRFATNLTITHQTLLNQVSFDSYVLVNLNQIDQLGTRQGSVTHERIALGNLLAEKIRYNLLFQSTDGGAMVSAITQYLTLSRNDAYVLTYATRLDELDHYASTFDSSASTFRLLGQ